MDLAAAVARLDDAPTRIAVTAERAVLATLEAGCSAPIGVHAEVQDDGDLRIRAVVYSPDGARRVGMDRTIGLRPGYARELSGSGNGADAVDGASPIARAERAGSDVARRLLERGAADVVPRESTQ